MELYRRIIFKKTLINNNYKNLGIVNNLININNIYNGLEIKIESYLIEPEIYMQPIKFKKPFKNKCFGILIVDDANSDINSLNTIRTICTDSSTITKEGFTALVMGKVNVYTVTYFAFGY